jgi:DNA-binding CsgD family transcriptional regulator
VNQNISFIPSIAYKLDIKSLCEPLNAIGHISYFVMYIIFNDGTHFILSNTPEDFLSVYWVDKYHWHDHSAKILSFGDKDYYICNENTGVDYILNEIMENKFSMHRTFYITRNSSECRLVFGAMHDNYVNNAHLLYKDNIHKFESFCIDFFDKMIPIIKFHNPNYNRSIILNDKYYRKSVIKNLNTNEYKLTEREVECLYWAANGKSSHETAVILKIKPSTVEEYRKKIKKKLNCNNLVQAVYEGVKRGYIGAFNRIQIK